MRLKIKNKCEYELVFVSSFKDADTMGECRFDFKQIAIKKGLTKRARVKTIIHEILHAIAYERGINLPHNSIYKLEDAILYLVKSNDLGGLLDEESGEGE